MTVSDQPRAAIIGAGLMGRWHADAVRRLGGRVTLIIDPNQTAREALARSHPEARVLPELDPTAVRRYATAAHVCSPLVSHEATIDALVNAGVHALVEKPFTESAESTARLLSLATSRRVVVCPVHQFLFQDGVQDLIASRTIIAPIRRVEFSTCSAGAAGTDAGSLDDLVSEILPHPLALVLELLGASVSRATWQVASPAPGEFHALATIGETAVSVAISAHGRPTENVLRVVGDDGSVTADLFHGYAVRHGSAASRRAKVARPFVAATATLGSALVNLIRRAARREPAYPGLRELISRFYAATNGDRTSPISADATLDVAVARDALIARIRSLRSES